MKKYLLVVLSAVVIGSIFALYIFDKDFDSVNVMDEELTAYVFQLGVFTSEDNANSLKDTVGASITVKVNEYYYVYGAVYTDVYLVSNLKTYYEENDINYQIKQMVVDDEFYDELTSYESILSYSDNIDVIIKANQIILDKYAILSL